MSHSWTNNISPKATILYLKKQKFQKGNESGLCQELMSDVYLFKSTHDSYYLQLRVSSKYLRILIGLTDFFLMLGTIILTIQTYQCDNSIWNAYHWIHHYVAFTCMIRHIIILSTLVGVFEHSWNWKYQIAVCKCQWNRHWELVWVQSYNGRLLNRGTKSGLWSWGSG